MRCRFCQRRIHWSFALYRLDFNDSAYCYSSPNGFHQH